LQIVQAKHSHLCGQVQTHKPQIPKGAEPVRPFGLYQYLVQAHRSSKFCSCYVICANAMVADRLLSNTNDSCVAMLQLEKHVRTHMHYTSA